MGFVMDKEPVEGYGHPMDPYGRPMDPYGQPQYQNGNMEEDDYGFGYGYQR